MGKELTQLVAPRTRKVALVDEGDNPPAQFVMWKRRERTRKDMDFVPRTFDEVVEERRAFDVSDAVDSRISALSSAVFDILISDETEKTALIDASVGQFAAAMSADLPRLFSGELVKHFGGKAPSSEVEVYAHLVAELAAADADGGKGDSMKFDKTKLPDDAREHIEGMEKKIAEVQEWTERNTTFWKAAEYAAALPEKPEPSGDDADPVLKSLSPEARLLVKAERSQAEKDRKAVANLLAGQRRTSLAKRCEIEGLGIKEEDLVERLLKMSDEDQTFFVETLNAASVLASKGLGPLGSDHDLVPDASSAEGQLDAMAKKIATRDSVTYEQGYAQAMEEAPELYTEVVEGAN